MIEDLPPKAFLEAFILEQIETQPVTRRVMLYRSLAHQTEDKTLKRVCLQLADDLERVQRCHRQLVLDFTRASL